VAPSLGSFVPVVATSTNVAGGEVETNVINYTGSDICPGTYGVVTWGIAGGEWTMSDGSFVVAVL
jgi:hypothetical protein